MFHPTTEDNFIMTFTSITDLNKRETFDLMSEVPGIPKPGNHPSSAESLLRGDLQANSCLFSIAEGTTLITRNADGDFYKVNLRKREISEIAELAPHKKMFGQMFTERWVLIKAYKERYLYF